MAPIEQDITKLKSGKIPVVWVLGGPGSGKGTQCAKLVERYGFQHLSSGDLLREEVASGSPKGKELNEMMKNGILVPLDVVLELIKEAMLKRIDTAKGFLIDGYPREVEQGVQFESQIAPCSLIIYFNCSDEAMTERLLKRGKDSGRVDDNVETIKKRLDTFHKCSEPVMDLYKEKVAEIDANTDTDTIFNQCKQRVDGVLTKMGVPLPS